MRIWSIHPSYLDSKGLVALWRETLLAKNVLQGNTIGYRNHPQLQRFKNSPNPVEYINQYLSYIYDESLNRNFNFDKRKFDKSNKILYINVNDEQIIYEFNHLLKKLKHRDINMYNRLKDTKDILPHPMFKIVKGDIEKWEII